MNRLQEYRTRREAFAEHGVIFPPTVEVQHYNPIQRVLTRMANFMNRIQGLGIYER